MEHDQSKKLIQEKEQELEAGRQRVLEEQAKAEQERITVEQERVMRYTAENQLHHAQQSGGARTSQGIARLLAI